MADDGRPFVSASVRAGVVVAAFVAGYVVVGLFTGICWLIVFQEVPDGGSGNSREGYAWFGIGGTIGAVVATATAVWLTRRHPSSNDSLNDIDD